MKVAFCTCVQIGLSCIEEILSRGFELALLITLHDHKAPKKSGRIYLDKIATGNRIPLLKINHVDDPEVIEALKKYDIDWLFIIGWSQIAGKEVIETPHLGAIGAHPTLLPEGRGRAAIPWAIIKGLDETGVTFFKMDEGVDTGEILLQKEIPIEENETATTLYEKVNQAHIALVGSCMQSMREGKLKGRPQDDSKATYWPGRKPEDGRITGDMTVEEVVRLVRATTRPYPGAFIEREGKKVIIWSGTIDADVTAIMKISCRDGVYYATQISN